MHSENCLNVKIFQRIKNILIIFNRSSCYYKKFSLFNEKNQPSLFLLSFFLHLSLWTYGLHNFITTLSATQDNCSHTAQVDASIIIGFDSAEIQLWILFVLMSSYVRIRKCIKNFIGSYKWPADNIIISPQAPSSVWGQMHQGPYTYIHIYAYACMCMLISIRQLEYFIKNFSLRRFRF